MACHCATINLGLFVRSVTQLDLRSTVLHAASNRAIRQPRITRHVNQQRLLNTKQAAVGHQYEAAIDEDSLASQIISPDCSSSSPKQEILNLPPSRRTERGKITVKQDSCNATKFNNYDRKGAIFEVNSITIDALAVEHRQDAAHRTAVPTRKQFAPQSYSPRPARPTFQTAKKQSPRSIVAEGYLQPEFQRRSRERHLFPVPEREPWQAQKSALKHKFEEGWNPRKRLSPDALAGIRAIHAQFPEQYTTTVLAERFEVSPEAIRRILKSKWAPKVDEELDRQRRWFSRGQQVWRRYAELGLKPPKKWRKLGIGKKEPPSSEEAQKPKSRTHVGAGQSDDPW